MADTDIVINIEVQDNISGVLGDIESSLIELVTRMNEGFNNIRIIGEQLISVNERLISSFANLKQQLQDGIVPSVAKKGLLDTVEYMSLLAYRSVLLTSAIASISVNWSSFMVVVSAGVTTITTWFARIGSSIVSLFAQIGRLLASFGSEIAGIVRNLVNALIRIGSSIVSLFAQIGRLLASFGSMLVRVGSSLIGMFVRLAAIVLPILQFIGSGIVWLGTQIAILVGSLSASTIIIIAAIIAVVASVIYFRKEIWEAIKFAVDFWIFRLTEAYQCLLETWENIRTATTEFADKWGQKLSDAVDYAVSYWKEQLSNLKAWLYGLLGGIKSDFTNFASWMYDTGKSIFSSLWKGMAYYWNTYVKPWLDSVLSYFEDLFKFGSPPKAGPLHDIDTWFRGFWPTLLDGMERGFPSLEIALQTRLGGLREQTLRSVAVSSGNHYTYHTTRHVQGPTIVIQAGAGAIVDEQSLRNFTRKIGGQLFKDQRDRYFG